MGKNSKIQWTEATWNPWHGCKKVSPGCKYCYMYRDKAKYGDDPTLVLKSKTKFNEPLKWQQPKMIFTCSWSDWFIEEADQWRPDAWEVIRQTPQHTYQILTKRPERIHENLPDNWGEGYDNVWIGVSVEGPDQCRRIEWLRNIPIETKFVSIEPLLASVLDRRRPIIERLDFNHYDQFLDWIIIGGESGNDTGKYRYRPCKKEWINEIIEWATWQEIPVFVKQLGTHLSKELGLKHRHGGDIEEWPFSLKIRHMPT